eukprot:GHVU01010912.1.p1 GENE.GHVU01010912.1~~GHVU01010912.1.p1  ORF type:complete len:134 (-),score=22.55 GHVU01010912.1:515-916(-)
MLTEPPSGPSFAAGAYRTSPSPYPSLVMKETAPTTLTTAGGSLTHSAAHPHPPLFVLASFLLRLMILAGCLAITPSLLVSSVSFSSSSSSCSSSSSSSSSKASVPRALELPSQTRGRAAVKCFIHSHNNNNVN